MITRVAIPSRGGPTLPVAVRTSLSAWQLPQPYWMNIASPRSTSPPTATDACIRIRILCSTYLYAMPISATAKTSAARMPKKLLLDRERTAASLGRFEPPVEEQDGRRAVHQSARNPHDQPGEPLVVHRVEADAGHPHRGVIGVPGTRGQAHQRAQRSADQRSREQAGGRDAIARGAAARGEHRPPEEERTDKEA